MGCAKDGNLKDFKSINRTAKEYQARQEKQADETIQACLQGKLTERQAKEALAKQFGHFRDRRGFQKAIEKLERELREQDKEVPVSGSKSFPVPEDFGVNNMAVGDYNPKTGGYHYTYYSKEDNVRISYDVDGQGNYIGNLHMVIDQSTDFERKFSDNDKG